MVTLDHHGKDCSLITNAIETVRSDLPKLTDNSIAGEDAGE